MRWTADARSRAGGSTFADSATPSRTAACAALGETSARPRRCEIVPLRRCLQTAGGELHQPVQPACTYCYEYVMTRSSIPRTAQPKFMNEETAREAVEFALPSRATTRTRTSRFWRETLMNFPLLKAPSVCAPPAAEPQDDRLHLTTTPRCCGLM